MARRIFGPNSLDDPRAGDEALMIIAIDGPAASGKSTLARALAKRLGVTFLDTGAMYRAVTWKVLEQGIAPDDSEGCAAVAAELDLRFDENDHIWVDGEAGEPDIRSPRVARTVPLVATHVGVRRALVPKQRAVALERGVVAEGRDTTTVVFPNADHKFFLIATSGERARRRALEQGRPEEIDSIEHAIGRRDEIDRTRSDSPLTQAADAILIETDGKSAGDVLAEVLSYVLGEAAR